MEKQHSLNRRILSILFVTFLPVISILVFVTWIMFQSMYDKVIEANQNEMQLFMKQMDNDLGSSTEDMKNLAILYRTQLYALNDASVIQYNMWKNLEDSRSQHSIMAAAFVRNGQRVDMSYDKSMFHQDEINKIKSFLLKDLPSDIPNFTYDTVNFGTRKFLILYAFQGNYEFGYLTDLDSLILKLQNIGNTPNTNYFASALPVAGKGRILSVQSEVTGYYLLRSLSDTTITEALPMGRKLTILLIFLCLMLFPVQWRSLRRYVVRPLGKISTAMSSLEKEDLNYRMSGKGETQEFTEIEQGFNQMADQIQNLKIETYEKDIDRLRMENLNLRLQVNPHMLLNSLNMIYSLSKSNNKEGVEKMSMSLSKYFRYTLYNDREFITIKDEIDFISSYMDIQKIRFPEAFSYVYDVEDNLYEEEIPTMLIQNFVENSIKYALNMESVVDIMVLVKKKEERLLISVIDTGNGMEEEILSKLKAEEAFEDYRGNHIGIWNCRRRLHMYYGDQVSFSISSKKGEGTQVWMEIPIRERSSNT